MSDRKRSRPGVQWGRAPRGSWMVVWAGVVLVVTILVIVGIVLPWIADQMG
jgi:hypothetical protein